MSFRSRRGRRAPLAPLASVSRLGPVRARTVSTLAPGLVSAALEQAEIVSEGDLRGETFFGTTMLTIDMSLLAERVRFDPHEDGPTLGRRLGRSAYLRLKTLRIARLEAERRLGGRLPGTLRAEVSTTVEGALLYIDVDVELEVDEPGRRESSP